MIIKVLIKTNLITSQRQAINKWAYHTIYSFPMTNKIFVTLPTFTLDYLSSWTTWKNGTQFDFISFEFLFINISINLPPFIACAETIYRPSGDHASRNTCVVPPHSSKGSFITFSHPQSFVRQIRTVRSSLCDAKNAPTYEFNYALKFTQNLLFIIHNYWIQLEFFFQITGSQATPLTKPLCPLSVVTDWKLFIHQMIMVLSTLLLANHLSWTDHARSRISPKSNNIRNCVCQYFVNNKMRNEFRFKFFPTWMAAKYGLTAPIFNTLWNARTTETIRWTHPSFPKHYNFVITARC